MSKIEKKGFEGEINPLAGNEVLTRPVAGMTVPERTQAHVILKFLKKQIEARLEQLHDPLLEDAKKHGEPTEAGGFRLYVEGNKVQHQKRTGKEPDYQKMVDLLVEKKLDVDLAYDKVTTYLYNPSKVSGLIERGHLKQADVDDLRKITYALVVEASPELEQLLAEAAKAYAPAAPEALDEGTKKRK
jgi:hypothetical protein